MERLTSCNKELEREMICRHEDCDTSETYCPHLNEANCPCLQEALNKLAHYEDLEEQGLLLKLPCKVGTPIYYIVSTVNRETNEWEYYVQEFGFNIDMCDSLGKMCFLTKEEAEQKLKELQEKEI